MNFLKKKPFLIAEISANHFGSIKIAKKLIDIASESGADAVKFQTFKVEELLTKNAKSMKHQLRSNKKISQYEMLKKLELTEKQHLILQNYSKKKKNNLFFNGF